MLSIGNDELAKKPVLGNVVFCKKCNKNHKVEYGDKVLKDGSKVPSKLIAFYKCKGKLYLAGLNGKSLVK